MLLFLLILLVIVGALAIRAHWIRTGYGLQTLALVAILAVGQGWVPQLLLRVLQDDSPLTVREWKERNAIVILGLGTVLWPDGQHWSTPTFGFSRVFEGARLYYQCKQSGKSCVVITSGGDVAHVGKTEAQVMKEDLIAIGLPAEAIRLEDQSRNTFQNAQFTSAMLKASPVDQLIVVTSGFHLPRSLMYFNHFRTPNIGAPSDRLEAFISWAPRAHNFSYFDIALHEYLGNWQYWIYNGLGWNPPKAL